MTNDNTLHLAIIPDGNRRWAKARTLNPWQGHEKAIENFRSLTDFCRQDPRVSTMTVWCVSTENWKRDPKEIDKLMKMLEDYLHKERETFHEEHTRFVHSGRKDRIPASLAELIATVEAETKDETGFTLHLAVDYGGKDELLRAAQRAISNQQLETGLSIDEDQFRSYLDHPELPDIDLIIRSSGEQRTSNFFLWQSTYAEWFFLDEHFPDITPQHLDEVLNDFEKRGRRFGG